MKKFKFIFLILLACLLIIPFGVFADGEEEETATESNDEVTIYLFRGEGCPHCEEFETWLEEIKPEYGDLFKVVDYEVWNDEKNAELMERVADARDEEASGVPYIIIGNKSWNGFADEYKEEILAEIKSLHEQEPAKRYDIMALLPEEEEESSSNGSSIAALIITLLAGGLIVFGVVKARKSTN